MTVADTSRKAGPFYGNGVTNAFPFDFKIFEKTDIRVVITDPQTGAATDAVVDSDYSVLLNTDQDAQPGGTVSYPLLGAPLAAGYSLTIIGGLPVDQRTDITNVGRFNPNVIEMTLDRTTIQIQQLEEVLNRTLQAAVGTTVKLIFPAPSSGKFIRWNSALSGLENVEAGTDSMALQGLLADSNNTLNGSRMVGYRLALLAAGGRTLAEKLAEQVSLLDFYANGSSGALVDPNGVLDSTAGIQAFFDSPAARKIMPPGVYKHSGPLRISKAESIYSDNAVLLYSGAGQNALTIAPATPGSLINKLKIAGMLTMQRAAVDYADNFAGLYIEALYSSELSISVAKFARGLHMHGTGTRGVVYNKFFIGEFENCKYSQYFTAAAGGWVNINTFFGGRYYGGTIGMLSHIEMDTTNYPFNGNKWVYPSLESSVAGHYLFNLKGVYNEILVGYAEHDGGTLPWALMDGTYNAVHSTAPYMAYARFNDATARLNITGLYCSFYGGSNDLRSAQAEMSRYLTASATLPAARFECSSATGATALDVKNSNNGTLNSLRLLNHDDSVGVALSASGRAWQVKGNTSGTIKKQVLWTEVAAPTTGTWMRGDIAYATNPAAGGFIGWVCTAGGTPGTWKGFGQIEV